MCWLQVSSGVFDFMCWFQVVLVISYVGFKWRLVYQMLVSRGAWWPCSIDDFALRLLKCVAELWHYSDFLFD